MMQLLISKLNIWQVNYLIAVTNKLEDDMQKSIAFRKPKQLDATGFEDKWLA